MRCNSYQESQQGHVEGAEEASVWSSKYYQISSTWCKLDADYSLIFS